MSHNSRQSIDSCTLQLLSWRPFHHFTIPPLSLNALAFPIAPLSPPTSIPSTFPSSLSLKMMTTTTTSIINPSPLLPADPTSETPYALSSARGGGEDPVLCPAGAPIEVEPGGAAHGTCSDFPVVVGTDSSGELFVNGDANWASDVSEAKNLIKEREEKENLLGVGNVIGNLDSESGYGSEPGYRGDAEFGYGDEVDEEEDDAKLLF